MRSYPLRPRIPRGTWLAVFLLVIGLTLVGVGRFALHSPAMWISGIVVAVLGLLLLAVSLWGYFRQRVWVTVDEEGYTIEGPRGEYSGAWIDVTDVQVSRRSAKIALYHGPTRRTIIAHPGRRMDDSFMKVREEIRQHLEGLYTG